VTAKQFGHEIGRRNIFQVSVCHYCFLRQCCCVCVVAENTESEINKPKKHAKQKQQRWFLCLCNVNKKN
jgi:hypothetical protein